MSARQIGLSLVLVPFLGLSVYAVYQYGVLGVLQLMTANAVTTTAFVDLGISLGLIVVWMWEDARDRGISPLPYTLLALTLGSVGPLLYLIRRDAAGVGEATHAAAGAR